MRKLSKKAKFAVVGTAVAAVVGGGVAYAYWTSSGSATDTATTSDGVSNLLIAQDNRIAGLAPGLTPQRIDGTITNNNPSDPAYVQSVTVSITSVTPAGAGPCDASDYTLTGATMPVDVSLNPGASIGFHGATLGFNNKATNQDGCKGATVNLAYVSN